MCVCVRACACVRVCVHPHPDHSVDRNTWLYFSHVLFLTHTHTRARAHMYVHAGCMYTCHMDCADQVDLSCVEHTESGPREPHVHPRQAQEGIEAGAQGLLAYLTAADVAQKIEKYNQNRTANFIEMLVRFVLWPWLPQSHVALPMFGVGNNGFVCVCVCVPPPLSLPLALGGCLQGRTPVFISGVCVWIPHRSLTYTTVLSSPHTLLFPSPWCLYRMRSPDQRTLKGTFV